MNIAIGIRVRPDIIFFSITKEIEAEIEILVLDKIVIPKSLETPEQLKFIRSTFLDIINEFEVNLGCIRIPESTARSVNIPRTYMEGVIQELIASSTIIKYYVGQISSISTKLGIERNTFKPLAEGKEVYNDLEIWNELSLEERESLLASFSALNI